MVAFSRSSLPRPRPIRYWLPFPLRLQVARVRAWLVRRRLRRRATIVGVLLLVSMLTLRSIDDARAARARWGDTTTVVVAGVSAAAGEPVRMARPELVDLPQVVVVADALTAMPRPDDRLRLSLRPGEVVTARHLSSGTGRDLAPRERALAVPNVGSTPPLRTGDLVDLVLVDDRTAGSGGEGTTRAVPARIIDPGGEAVIVAVQTGDIGVLARSLARGEIVIAVR